MEIRKDDQPGCWTHLSVFLELFTKQKHLSHVSQTDDLRKDHLIEKKTAGQHGKPFSNTADENEQNRSLNKTSNQFERRILMATLSTFNFKCLCPMRASVPYIHLVKVIPLPK